MRIDEAVKHMTKQYLGRIQESFTKDLGPQDEDEIRDYIVRNSDELARLVITSTHCLQIN